MRTGSRRIIATLAAVGLTLGIASCSDDGDNGGDDDASHVETEGTFPQTVTTKFGDVTVEEQPERVVALGWGDAETALALGVQPVGASDWVEFGGDGVGPWIGDSGSSYSTTYDSAPEMIETMEPDFEEIAALDPDLILDVRSSGEQDRYDKLSEVAPTVGVPEGGDSYLTPREEQVSMVSTALGQVDEGEEINQRYEESVAQIREDHPEWAEKTAATVSLTSKGWGAYIRGSERYDTLLDLGFQENTTLADEEVSDSGFSVTLSEETLSKADSDLVIAFPIGVTDEDVTADKSWQRLTATKDGHSFVLPEDVSNAYALGSPQAIEYALEKMVPLLEEHSE